MRVRWLVLLFTTLVQVIGCGSDGDGDGDGGGTGNPSGTPVSAEEFPAQFATSWCELLAGCCQTSGGTPEGSCTDEIQTELAARGQRAAADGASWNESAAASCLEAIEAADCAASNPAMLLSILEDCDDTWDGVVPPGGACEYHESCAEPAVSGGASAGASCVNSMCVQVVRLAPGAACTDSDPLSTCNPFLAACVAGVCEALPGPGEPCSDDCSPGARCTDGECQALLGAGEACEDDSDCASDQCSAGACASTFVDSEYCALP